MVQANIRPDPSIRRFEAYMNFSGGLNTEISNETMRENEFLEFDNMELLTRGSAKRRTGRVNELSSLFASDKVGQGVFFYYRDNQPTPDIILAVSGRLYHKPPTAWAITGETPTGTINGTNKVFTVANPFLKQGTVVVKVNSVVVPFFNLITVNNVVPSGAINGINRTYTLPNTFVTVNYNGVLVNGNVAPTSTYTVNYTTGVITFNTPLATGSTLVVSYKYEARNYAIDFATGVITFTTAPTSGSTVTVDYNYELRQITIQNLSGGVFQTTKSIEAVQFGSTMYIATGTKYCELAYDTSSTWTASTAYVVGKRVKVSNRLYECTVAGTSSTTAPTHTTGTATDGGVTWNFIATLTDNWYAKVVVPYKPTVLETIYVGTNGLADSPSTWIENTTDDNASIILKVLSVLPSTSSAVVNTPTTFTVYVGKPTSITTLQGKWEYKKSTDTTWTQIINHTDFPNGKSITFTFPTVGEYDIRVNVQDKTNTSNNVNYILGNYVIKNYEDPHDEILPNTGINQCTKIKQHWDRLILSGDVDNPYQIYISDLNAPNYYPSTNTISFDIGKKEPIVSLTRYKGNLVILTKTTVQMLQGQSPSNYVRRVIHDNIGCIAGNSVQVVRDDIMFLSDEGIYRIYPSPLSYETLRINRVDTQIKGLIPNDANACSLFYNNQYWICFPSQSLIYRYYYDIGAWARDSSTKLNLKQFLQYGETIYNLTTHGNLWKHDDSVYYDISTDDGIYEMSVTSKFLDLSAQFNNKKLKRLYVLARHYNGFNTQVEVRVYADSAIVLSPDSGYATVDSNGYTVWVDSTEPNMSFYTGTDFGSWLMGQSPFGDVDLSVQKSNITGKCRRVKVSFKHQQNSPCEIYGFGLEYKIKRI